MKRVLPPLCLGILFLALQSTLLTFPFLHRIRPDLVLILTLYLGLSYPPLSGGLIAFLLGYGMDLLSGNTFGLYTFSRLILFYWAQLFKNRIYLENFFLQSLLVFLFTLADGLLVLFLLRTLNPEPWRHLIPPLFTSFLPHSLSTALVSPFLFALFHRVFFLFQDYRMGEKG